MKLIPSLLLLAGAIFSANELGAAGPAAAFSTPASLVKNGVVTKIQLLAADGNIFTYRLRDQDSPLQVNLEAGDAIFVEEPAAYSAAMNLFRARKYREAKIKFAEVRERFQPVARMNDTPAVLAGFHELECLRKSGDLEGLAKALQGFSKERLVREYQLRQLEIYILWDAVRTKSWQRLEALARDRQGDHLGPGQRAQVEYCHGLALEELGRPGEALVCYNMAMTADAGASEAVAREAALGILRIRRSDPEIDAALRRDAKAPRFPETVRAKLAEAGAVARFYKNSLGSGTPLPDNLKVFLAHE